MEDGLAEFFAQASASSGEEAHFAAQWKAYASDEPLTAALWLINNADPQAFPAAPAKIAALQKAAQAYSLEKMSASTDEAKLAGRLCRGKPATARIFGGDGGCSAACLQAQRVQ